MFKIGSGRHTWVAVKWPGLAEDGSKVENEIQCQITLVDRDVFQLELDREKNPDANPNHAVEFAQANTRDWKGVGDVNGNPLPFSAENFAQLIQSPAFLFGWGQAYITAWGGVSGIREGNSAPSPADGQAAGELNPPKEA